MYPYTKSQREFYNDHRQYVLRELGLTQNQYNWFRRVGDQLHHIYEQSCNGEIDEQTYEELTEPLYKKAQDKAKELELFIFFQTDPRGATIYLDKKEIPYNNYNKASCIY